MKHCKSTTGVLRNRSRPFLAVAGAAPKKFRVHLLILLKHWRLHCNHHLLNYFCVLIFRFVAVAGAGAGAAPQKCTEMRRPEARAIKKGTAP